MVVEPMNPTVMNNYRTALQVNGAPSFIDSSQDVQPVAMIGHSTSQTAPMYVAVTDGTDLALVDGSGNLGVQAFAQWKSSASASVFQASGSQTITVPANKIWIVTSAWAYWNAGVSNVGVNGISNYLVYTSASQFTDSWSGTMKLTAGQTLNLAGSSGASYVEIDA